MVLGNSLINLMDPNFQKLVNPKPCLSMAADGSNNFGFDCLAGVGLASAPPMFTALKVELVGAV